MSATKKVRNWRVSDKNPMVVAAVAAAVIVVVVLLAVKGGSLPFISPSSDHAAYLTNASGLSAGDAVQVRGVRVGEIDDISLQGNRVRVDFHVDHGLRLGTLTSADVKVLNPLGTEFLQLTPAGPGRLSGPIPLARTHVALTLLGDLGEVTQRVQKLNLDKLQKALDVSTTNLSATSQKAVSRALTGLARFSSALGDNAQDVKKIVTQGSSIAKILDQRRDELVNLIGQGDTVLKMLRGRQRQITTLLHGTADLSREVSAILQVNEKQLNPMLRDLQHISDVLSKENRSISAALPALASMSSHLAAATGNGPFIDVVVPTGLLPDALIQQCTDAAYPAPSNPVVGCRP